MYLLDTATSYIILPPPENISRLRPCRARDVIFMDWVTKLQGVFFWNWL